MAYQIVVRLDDDEALTLKRELFDYIRRVDGITITLTSDNGEECSARLEEAIKTTFIKLMFACESIRKVQ